MARWYYWYMKIAMMVRGYMPVPRPKDILYAPIDLAVAIAKGLADKGHSVDFYAPETSKLPAPVETKTLGMRPLVTNGKEWAKHLETIKPHVHYVPWLWDNKFVEEMFERADKGEYDVLFFHHPELALSYARRYPRVRVVSVLHDPLYDWYADIFKLYPSPNIALVSISDHQRRDHPEVPFAETVHNGVDTAQFSFNAKPGDYLLFSGRIVPEKGVAEAVQVARKTGQKLVIAGLVFSADQDYFDTFVKPFLSEDITYAGYIPREDIAPYYQNARALLMPVTWAEPFGMTMVEAMACGTPVIAFNKGAVPEVIQDGKTGFIVDSVDGMAAAVSNLPGIDRRDCRQHVEAHFSLQAMVDRYEALFARHAHRV